MLQHDNALNNLLASSLGDDPQLLWELRMAFLESADRQIDLMRRARCDANWFVAAERLKGLAASFGVSHIIELSEQAMEGAPGDPAILRDIGNAVDNFREDDL